MAWRYIHAPRRAPEAVTTFPEAAADGHAEAARTGRSRVTPCPVGGMAVS